MVEGVFGISEHEPDITAVTLELNECMKTDAGKTAHRCALHLCFEVPVAIPRRQARAFVSHVQHVASNEEETFEQWLGNGSAGP